VTDAMLTRAELTAISAAREAGGILRTRFREQLSLEVEQKGPHDFVTEVDRQCETAIVSRLRADLPDIAIQAEEGSPDDARAAVRWIVDPLDGTTNFIQGVATFAVSIGLVDEDGLAVGVVFDPVHDELFHAVRGAGARLNGQPLRVSDKRDLDTAVLATGFPFRMFEKLDGYVATLRTLMTTTAGIRRAGSAALDLAHTACGRYDAFFEVGLSPWDIAAGALLVVEAGGLVTDCGGGDRFIEDGEIVAGGPGLHAAVLDVTRRHLV
jgi:myo-inositol-1(or 4)-monophosphatase